MSQFFYAGQYLGQSHLPPQPAYAYSAYPSFQPPPCPPQVQSISYFEDGTFPYSPSLGQKHFLAPDTSAVEDESPAKKSKRTAKVPWKDDADGYKKRGPSSLNKYSSKLEDELYGIADGSSGDAADLIVRLAQRLPQNAITKVVQGLSSKGDVFHNRNVANCVRKFCNKPTHTSTSGTRKMELQNALNAVAVAVQYGKEEGTPDDFYVKLLGLHSTTVQKAHAHAMEIMGDDGCFHMVLGGFHTDEFLELQYKKRACVSNWQHSWNGSRVDTNSVYLYSVCDPNGVKCTHARRCFHECGLENAYARFVASDEYRKFKFETGREIHLTKFKELLCPCTRDPSEKSCVDVIYSSIDHCCRALCDALHHNTEIKEGKKACNCHECTHTRGFIGHPRDFIGPMPRHFWMHHDIATLLQERPESLVSAACCKKVEHPELKGLNDTAPPKLVKWDCARGKCAECGRENKLQALDCEFLKSCDTIVPVKVWRDAPRGDGTMQYELSQDNMPVNDIVEKLLSEICAARIHYARDRWTNAIQNIHAQILKEYDLLIKADFSATIDLRAADADNSSQDNHAVVLIMTVSHSFRDVVLENKDAQGNVTSTEIFHTCDTDHWSFFGPSGGKSKKNDHIFYNACKDYVIKFYKAKLAAQGKTLRRVKVWTDNCPGQFGCVQTYSEVAKGDELYGIIMYQYFAEKFCFKSVVDGEGKVLKFDIIKKKEWGGTRSPHAFGCVLTCLAQEEERRQRKVNPGQDWAKLEAEHDIRLKKKGPLTLHHRYHIYVTDDAADVEQRVAGGFPRDQIILTNRRQCDEVSGCDNSKSFWAFEGLPKARAQVLDRNGAVEDNKYQLDMKFMPCFCGVCQENEDISLWEQENEQYFIGPRNQCPNHDDIASLNLPEPLARVPGQRRPNHVFYGQTGVCTVMPHINVSDEDLLAYISPMNNGTYVRSTLELNMQLRCRDEPLLSNKEQKVKKLREYLVKKGILQPEPALPPPAAALPNPNMQVLNV